MKPKGRYRVLLMCKKCEKVYNGSPFVDYEKAMRIYHSTLVSNTDKCKEKDCEEPLIAEIQDMEKPKDVKTEKTKKTKTIKQSGRKKHSKS